MATFQKPYGIAGRSRANLGAVDCSGDEPMTKQSFKDECDINVLMRRYETTGLLPVGVGVAKYEDFSEVGDFMQAQATLERARAQFASLPARVRDRFRNSASEFLGFVSNPSNYEEALSLGLLSSEAVSKIPVVPPVSPVGSGVVK